MKPVRKDLVVSKQTLQFTQTPQTDAEGQLAKRTFHTNIDAGPKGGAAIGQIPGLIEYVSTAGELSKGVRTACQACRHWNPKAWKQMFEKSTGPLATAEDKSTLAGLRTRLETAYGPGGGTDEVILTFGVCNPLSEIIEGWVGKNPIHWPAVTQDNANCPKYVQAEGHRTEITTDANPYGLFKAKDLDATKIGAKRYDAVLNDASGKIR